MPTTDRPDPTHVATWVDVHGTTYEQPVHHSDISWHGGWVASWFGVNTIVRYAPVPDPYEELMNDYARDDKS